MGEVEGYGRAALCCAFLAWVVSEIWTRGLDWCREALHPITSVISFSFVWGSAGRSFGPSRCKLAVSRQVVRVHAVCQSVCGSFLCDFFVMISVGCLFLACAVFCA